MYIITRCTSPSSDLASVFDTKKTTVCDTLLQSTLVAYRSDDWWYYASESDLVLADTTTQIGRWIDDIGRAGNWGSADSWPATRGAEICGLEATQNGRKVRALEDDSDDDRVNTMIERELAEDLFPFGFPDEEGEIANGNSTLATSPVESKRVMEAVKRASRFCPRTCAA
jgi:hypothetical protein